MLEMASMVAGVQYGLSSHTNFNENKSVIFVKLTESAQRAIDDYLSIPVNYRQNPSIQFQGDKGQVSFPSTQSQDGLASFNFSLSGNQDIEGPQGGFECIQQTGPNSLESLGAIPIKMRIHAKEDVFEKTKNRMAANEENNKNKSTKIFLKANVPDIGRKVKVKGTGRTIPPPPAASVRLRETPNVLTSGANSSRFSSSTSLSSSKPVSRTPTPARSKSDKLLPEIAKTPIRERLIHLLALRPYKKLEIYDRISQEGCRDRDRSKISDLLSEIAFNRDNTYHLKRAVWNDVRDNWIHYTEEEKSLLKRRKPQNLTPPGSSDGSSGSGQSPNSVHPGSPPAITAPPAAILKSKRPGYYEGKDGFPTKKQRISHYVDNRRTAGGSVNSGDCRLNSGDIRLNSGDSRLNSGDSRLNSGDSRVNSADSRMNSADSRMNRVDSRISRVDNRINSADNRLSSVERVSGSVNGLEVISGSNSGTCNSGSNLFARQSSNSSQRQQNRLNCAERTTNNELLRGSSYSASGLCLSASDSEDDQKHSIQECKLGVDDRRNHGNNTNNRLENPEPGVAFDPTTSPNSSNNVTNNASTQTAQGANHHEVYPDYLTYYTTITSAEQKRRYKDEFNKLYPEYKKLFDLINPIETRYFGWKKRYEETKAQGNQKELDLIRVQILQHYRTINNDVEYKRRSARKNYLHGKLAYLKTLVEEYDINCVANNTIPQEKENQLY